MRHPLGALLVEAGADLPGDLGLHELADEPGERLTQDVGVLIAQQLAYELVEAQALLGCGFRAKPITCSGPIRSGVPGFSITSLGKAA